MLTWELRGNETRAAKKYGETFYLCSLLHPEAPKIYLVRDPGSVGKKEKLTIRVNDRKAGRWSRRST